jgi:hypothetical protein
LQELLPTPALAWLQSHGAHWRPGSGCKSWPQAGGGWQVDGEAFDAVVLACSATEAARLLGSLAPDWSTTAAAMAYQPIVTVWLRHPGLRWPQAMMAFPAQATPGLPAPAQFGFDLGRLGLAPDTFALVISGAAEWVARGTEDTVRALRRQLQHAFAQHTGLAGRAGSLLAVRTEKRATFACTPGLRRPRPAPCPAWRWRATMWPVPSRPRWKVPCAADAWPSKGCCKLDGHDSFCCSATVAPIRHFAI